MSLRLYKATTAIPQYVHGEWRWPSRTDTIEFHRDPTAVRSKHAQAVQQLKFGIQFTDHMDETGENIFRETFRRPEWSRDSDVITIQDIKDVAMFTAPKNAFSHNLIDLIHCETVDEFLNDLIIYFEYFLKLVEFLLIRRGEMKTKQLDMRSLQIEQMLSGYLVQYRLILAREYSKIVMGWRDTSRFHHLENKSKRSNTAKDSVLFESFTCLCTRIVWIAMHRKSYVLIDCELNRLLRSDHFNVAQRQHADAPVFSRREQQVLFGPNNVIRNYRSQKSPLILELLNIKPKDSDVLWINENKYRGSNPRMNQLEMEYVTADGQLNLCDVHHGILGNPKSLYNTLLEMDGHAVRKEHFTEAYDPYQLARQPTLEIPNWEEYIKTYKKNEPYFRVVSKKFEPDVVGRQKRLWKNRDRIIANTDLKSKVNRNIIQRCQREVHEMDQDFEIDRDGIIARFVQERDRKMKKI